jgi:error-prone DNA polymerase
LAVLGRCRTITSPAAATASPPPRQRASAALSSAPAGAPDGFAPPAPDPHREVVADYHALGLSVAGHPMGRHRAWCERVGAVHSAAVARCRGGERVVVAGLVIVRQRPSTAKGTVFLLLEDEHGTVNAIVNRRLAESSREAVHHEAFVVVYGRAERSGPLVNVIAGAVEALGAAGADAGDALTYRSHDFH